MDNFENSEFGFDKTPEQLTPEQEKEQQDFYLKAFITAIQQKNFDDVKLYYEVLKSLYKIDAIQHTFEDGITAASEAKKANDADIIAWISELNLNKKSDNGHEEIIQSDGELLHGSFFTSLTKEQEQVFTELTKEKENLIKRVNDMQQKIKECQSQQQVSIFDKEILAITSDCLQLEIKVQTECSKNGKLSSVYENLKQEVEKLLLDATILNISEDKVSKEFGVLST